MFSGIPKKDTLQPVESSGFETIHPWFLDPKDCQKLERQRLQLRAAKIACKAHFASGKWWKMAICKGDFHELQGAVGRELLSYLCCDRCDLFIHQRHTLTVARSCQIAPKLYPGWALAGKNAGFAFCMSSCMFSFNISKMCIGSMIKSTSCSSFLD